jgi:hypothetical protein
MLIENSNVVHVLENRNLEKFSVYGFSIDYPSVCRVEFSRKSRRESGDVVFHFPDKEQVILLWGDLGKAKKRFHTVEEHAEHAIRRISTSGTAKSCERVTKDSIEVNSHKAAYNRIRVNEVVGGLFSRAKTVPREGYSVHLHCQNSSRYFVISTLLSSKGPEDFGDLMRTMIDSFKCH